MDREKLLQALKLAKPALGMTNLIPGLDCFFFDAENSTITAFNGSLEIVATLAENPHIRGAVQGETLVKLLERLDGDVDISNLDNSFVLQVGRSKTTFPVKQMDTSFLQDVEEEGNKVYLPVDAKFANGLRRCILSMSAKSKEIQEVGIHIFIEGNECKMYSSNNKTGSRFTFPVESIEDNQIFLPATFCEQLMNLYLQTGLVPLEISVSSKYARAIFENVTLRCSFYSHPVNTGLREIIDFNADQAFLVEMSTEFKDAIKRSEAIADFSITIDYGESDTLFIRATGAGKQDMVEEVSFPYPAQGTLELDVKSIKKVMDTCKQVGLGEDYIVFLGVENCFHHILTTCSDG